MSSIIIFFIISLSFFDNLWFVGSFDNILVFFPLIIINLWFVCFFDDSIRVRLVPLIIFILVRLVPLIILYVLFRLVPLIISILVRLVPLILICPGSLGSFC